MLRWIIFSTLAAGVFYGLYCLTMRRDRWLQLSLWYLLATLGFSIVIPLFSLPERLASASQTVIPSEEYAITLDEISISANAAPRAIGLTEVYLVGIALCAGYLLFQIAAQTVAIIRLRHKHTVYRAADGFAIPRRASLILLDDNTESYSYFNQIVVGSRGLSDEGLRCILAHESLHVSRHHTIDLLCARMMCSIAWFNPFAWLIMRELRAVQEFQADEASISSCGREDYLHLLYRQATSTGYGHITNNFQSINLKKRITMMKRKKSRYGAWKTTAVLPVAALLMMVGCKPGEAQSQATQPALGTSEMEVIVEETADSMPVDTTSAQVKVSSKTITVTKSGSNGGPTASTDTPDTDPEFPGGMEALFKYVSDNIRYPEQAKTDGVQGRVMVRFVIEADGSITNAEVLKGISKECDQEALRVVQNMPKWQPATVDGKPVRLQYVFPINFKLN